MGMGRLVFWGLGSGELGSTKFSVDSRVGMIAYWHYG